MPLAPGTRLGPYEIGAPLGAGGMGQVYRARDTRLERTVAIKVLLPELAANAELTARFEREARTIAALQHPHICVLHDIGHEGSAAFLVMEYLEGETLASRLRRGPLPLAEVVTLGTQIADALERAHRAGIVHRDLKPANIMLTKGGANGASVQAKLLDFGLAKSGGLSSIAPTMLEAGTQVGAVLGTIPYMAPEQMGGQAADVRSDMYAFGCVLYEMVTGEVAYKGVRTLAPPGLDRLVQACLARDPDARVQSAHDAALMLTGAGDTAATAEKPTAGRWRWWAALAAVGILAVLATWWLRPVATPARTLTEITAPPGVRFDFGGSFPGPPVISPDGKNVAFVVENAGGRTSLWLRPFDAADAHELPGTEDALYPFWSPDSSSLAFFTQIGTVDAINELMVLNLAGGLPRPVTDITTARGGAWSSNGTIVYAPYVTGGLMQVPASGGAGRPVGTCDASQFSSCRFPYFLPDGQHFLYMAISHDDPSKDMMYLASLDGAMNRPLVHSLTGGIYADGRLLYSADGTLMAQLLSSTGTLSGAPLPVAHGVFDDTVTWRPAYSASHTGVIVYASGSDGAQQAAWVDRTGKFGTPLAPYAGQLFSADISPDGTRLAVSLDNGLQDVWTENMAGGPRSRLTFGPISNLDPVWSPDLRWIAYAGSAHHTADIMRRPAGGGPETVIATVPADSFGGTPMAWSHDGEEIACLVTGNRRDSLVGVPVSGSGPWRPIVVLDHKSMFDAKLSPDNRWASYLAGEPGQPANLFVVPFRGGAGTTWQVTTGGAVAQFWVKDGRELDVVDGGGRLVAIPVSVSGNSPVFGAPQVLAVNFPPVFAATADGMHFLATRYPDDHQHINVLTGWTSGLR